MATNPDADGWYHTVPLKTLDDWKEGQKIWGYNYDQTFCRPVITKVKQKRKAKYNIHALRVTERPSDSNRKLTSRLTSDSKVKQKTDGRALEAKVSKKK